MVLSPFDLISLVKYTINMKMIEIVIMPIVWSKEKVGSSKIWLFIMIKINDENVLNEANSNWNFCPLINFVSNKKTRVAKNPKSGL